MRTVFIGVGLIAVLAIGVVLIGCSNNNGNPVSSPTSSPALTVAGVSPTNGSTGVPVNTQVVIAFSDAVDTASVTRNMHLAGGADMAEWLDSLQQYGGFGAMGMGMQNHMIHWMDSIQTVGSYYWNANLDSCSFIPAKDLQANSQYTCVYYEGGMMGTHGDMVGGSNQANKGYHMFEFRTAP